MRRNGRTRTQPDRVPSGMRDICHFSREDGDRRVANLDALARLVSIVTTPQIFIPAKGMTVMSIVKAMVMCLSVVLVIN